MRLLIMIALLAVLLVGCGQSAAPSASQEPQAAAPAAAEQVSPNISAPELAAQLQQEDRPFLLDVREPFEADIASIPGTSTQIPLGQLQRRMGELDPSQEIVVYCRSGNRSQHAMQVLQAAGFSNVRNLSGGILGWSQEVDPSMPQY
jgi:adenylyltransferase/sulfurtransferase